MKQKKEKAKTNGHVTYTVTFVPSETVYLKQMDSYRDRNHYATVPSSSVAAPMSPECLRHLPTRASAICGT